MVQHIYRYHAPECESNRRSSGKDKTFFVRSLLYAVPDTGSRCQYYINRLVHIKKLFLCKTAKNCQGKAGYGNVARTFLVKGGQGVQVSDTTQHHTRKGNRLQNVRQPVRQS